MKVLMLLSCFSALTIISSTPTSDQEAIKKAVKTFATAADQQDVEAMDAILHPEYRAVLNQLFGSKQVTLLDKASYLAMLKAKKIGGDKRSIAIQTVDINDLNAMVKVQLKGAKATFTTYLLLAKGSDQMWRIISDMPTMEQNAMGRD